MDHHEHLRSDRDFSLRAGASRAQPNFLFQAMAPARSSGALVTFEPGARTAWHTNPLGQILIVTADTGRVHQCNARTRETL